MPNHSEHDGTLDYFFILTAVSKIKRIVSYLVFILDEQLLVYM